MLYNMMLISPKRRWKMCVFGCHLPIKEHNSDISKLIEHNIKQVTRPSSLYHPLNIGTYTRVLCGEMHACLLPVMTLQQIALVPSNPNMCRYVAPRTRCDNTVQWPPSLLSRTRHEMSSFVSFLLPRLLFSVPLAVCRLYPVQLRPSKGPINRDSS